jgi:hypothetical protein
MTAIDHRPPIDGTALRPQLAAQALCGLEHIAGNANLTLGSRPDALEQPPGWKGDIELSPVEIGIRLTPEQYAAREFPIASSSTSLLIVCLRGWRGRPVNDEADIRLVDAHAEGAGGDHDVDPVSEKIVQRCGSAGLRESGMVGSRTMTGISERTCNCLCAASSWRVHDGQSIVATDQRQESPQPLPLRAHGDSSEPQVRPVKGT